MFRGRRLLATGLVLAGLVLAACGGSGGSAAATPAPSSAGKVLPAGTYSSLAFTPMVTYTVPDGWESLTDAAAFFQIRPFASESASINLFADPLAAIQDAACTAKPDPAVGKTSTDLVKWISGLPGLTVSTPALTTIGGLPGQVVDIGLKKGWNQSCPFAGGLPTVPLLDGASAGYHWVVYGDERMRLYVLDRPDGGTVAIGVDTVDGTVFDQLISQATPIVKSMQFKTGS